MDQNNQPSQPTQPTPQPESTAAQTPVTPSITPEQTSSSTTQPVPNPTQPPAANETPKKNHMKLFIIVGVCVLLIAVMMVYIFGFSSKKPALTQQAPTQVSQQTVTSPTPAISQTVQDEVNSVDVNADNSDIKDVQKDVNSL